MQLVVPHHAWRHPSSTPFASDHARHSRGSARGARSVRVSAEQQPDEDQQDFIERWYGKVFGKKALEDRNPFGMKRLGADEAPEMFPATTDRMAAPVKGDDLDAALVRPLMAGTRLEAAPLR